MGNPMVVVVGAGPGVSGSVARRFAGRGYDVGLVGLGESMLRELAASMSSSGVGVEWADTDVTDPTALSAAVDRLGSSAGRIDVLHFNPSAYRPANPLEITVPELLEDLALGVGALLTAVQAARPYLSRGSRVTATGSVAADKPSPEVVSLGVQKAALRNLVRSLDRFLAADGIRAVSVTVDGVLNRDDPGSPFHPDQVAAALVDAAEQDESEWRNEVVYRG